MKNNAVEVAFFKDGWTHDPDYRSCYQAEPDLETR